MSGDRWELGYRPGLDGLRAVAVVLVIAVHAEVPGFAGGQVGVDVFFTLSGFLITALLLAEFDRDGRIDLRAFWMRRVRRLVPAMTLMVAVVSVAGAVVPSLSAPSRLAVVGAATWTVNLMRSWLGSPRGLFGHLWSLGLEEQFYLVWPVVFVVARRRSARAVAVAAATAVAVVAVWRAYVFADAGWFALYARPDTRADAMMVGCALAVAFHLGWMRSMRSLSAGALVVLAGLVITSPPPDPFYYYGGFTVVAACAAVMIAHVVAGGWSWMSDRRLVWVGRRSYAIYLWQTPLVIWARDVGVTGWPAVLLVVTVGSVGVAAVSWRWERRWSGDRRRDVEPAERDGLTGRDRVGVEA